MLVNACQTINILINHSDHCKIARLFILQSIPESCYVPLYQSGFITNLTHLMKLAQMAKRDRMMQNNEDI